MLDGSASDRIAVQVGHEELPGRRAHLVWERRGADRRVEAALRAPVELGDVLGEAVARVGVLGVDGHDPHARRAQQTLDVAHRGDQPLLLTGAEGRQQRARMRVGALVERGTLDAARGREVRDAKPAVALAGRT